MSNENKRPPHNCVYVWNYLVTENYVLYTETDTLNLMVVL